MAFTYKNDSKMKLYAKFVGYYINSLYLCTQIGKYRI